MRLLHIQATQMRAFELNRLRACYIRLLHIQATQMRALGKKNFVLATYCDEAGLDLSLGLGSKLGSGLGLGLGLVLRS